MDYTKPVVVSTNYLGNVVSVQFPSVLDEGMQRAITELNTKRVKVDRQGKGQIQSFALRVKFFDDHALKVVEGVDVPKTGDFRKLIPVAIKDDLVAQIESADSVSEAEEGNSEEG